MNLFDELVHLLILAAPVEVIIIARDGQALARQERMRPNGEATLAGSSGESGPMQISF
jgi:hypothetical protein